MKTIMRMFTAVAVILLPTFSFAASYNIDPDHSNVGFKIRHLMVSNVKGVFHSVRGVVKIDDSDITKSTVKATIETASIDTGVNRRDKDLKSANYFDVAKYPAMTFASTGVTRSGEGKLKVAGDLTLHGVTRQVVLDVEGPTPEVKDPKGSIRRGASASARISRKEFGITSGSALIGDEVGISLEVEMVKAPAE